MGKSLPVVVVIVKKSKKVGGAGMCRYGMECRRKDCKFDHPSDAESQIQNEIEEDEFQDANTEQANQNDAKRENT